MTDATQKGRFAKRFTKKQVQQIRLRVEDGELQKDLAKEYKVCRAAIWKIVHRKTWNYA